MKHLDAAIGKLALELHPERIESIASALESVIGVDLFNTVKANAGLVPSRSLLDELKAALGQDPEITGRDLAGKFRSAGATAFLAGSISSTELVWTGPSTGMVPIRHTAQVLKGLIDGAERDLFLVSFVAYNVADVLNALQRAIARGVRVRILLERSTADGGTLDLDAIEMMREALPGAEFLAWIPNDSSSFPYQPKVHAKCAVADGVVAFVTSANLTNAAMENNVELGLLVKGGPIPESLSKHLDALVTTGELKLAQ